jgi:hypothetical protein
MPEGSRATWGGAALARGTGEASAPLWSSLVSPESFCDPGQAYARGVVAIERAPSSGGSKTVAVLARSRLTSNATTHAA